MIDLKSRYPFNYGDVQGWRVYTYKTIDSTNLEALRFLEQVSKQDTELQPTVFLARQQTDGQGRQGKEWSSPPGGLYYTLVAPYPDDEHETNETIEARSLAIGELVIDSLKKVVMLPYFLKRPNDILVKEKKLAGILTELRYYRDKRAIIIGVGINVNQATFFSAILLSATSLYLETSKTFSIKEITTRLTQNFTAALEANKI